MSAVQDLAGIILYYGEVKLMNMPTEIVSLNVGTGWTQLVLFLATPLLPVT